jgi:hypothetical protein
MRDLDPAVVEQACRIMHDAHTGRITPDASDPTDYHVMATALVSHGWGPTRQIQIDTLLAARDAAREARRLCWAEERDEHTIRHWGATAGWLASRAKKIEAGEEPDRPDAASSMRTDLDAAEIEVTD